MGRWWTGGQTDDAAPTLLLTPGLWDIAALCLNLVLHPPACHLNLVSPLLTTWDDACGGGGGERADCPTCNLPSIALTAPNFHLLVPALAQCLTHAPYLQHPLLDYLAFNPHARCLCLPYALVHCLGLRQAMVVGGYCPACPSCPSPSLPSPTPLPATQAVDIGHLAGGRFVACPLALPACLVGWLDEPCLLSHPTALPHSTIPSPQPYRLPMPTSCCLWLVVTSGEFCLLANYSPTCCLCQWVCCIAA